MTADRYQPISCDYHDQLEEAALHRKQIELEFELEGVPQKERGTIADVFTRQGAEFVKFVALSGPVIVCIPRRVAMYPAAPPMSEASAMSPSRPGMMRRKNDAFSAG